MRTEKASQSVIALLKALGFSPVVGVANRQALKINGYEIGVLTVDGGRVDYGKAIRVERETSLDLRVPESRVVLECVVRLLRQGYSPSALILEKRYPAGRKDTFLDILVEENGEAFLMVECKTWSEYDPVPNGAQVRQLLTYLQQDQQARMGCLYASRVNEGAVEPAFLALDNQVLLASKSVARKNASAAILAGRNLFDEEPYQKPKAWLVASDLKAMGPEDGSEIFNGFAKILRRYVVSDKPNSFNKIFNLFICKVWDEEKEGDDRLDFQWLPGEESETVIGRLNDLYRQGLRNFLNMKVSDHTLDEFREKLRAIGANPTSLGDIERVFTDLRLYKNNEFGFYEVYDQKTFRENAEIVRDVVQLLQGWRLRYNHRNQFMGEFFERLLNTSVKQEAGQFFTPLPVARFICDALPFEQIIDDKIARSEPNFLPQMIDYAAGSGHFLTEGMERVDKLLNDRIRAKVLKGKKQKDNGESWRTGYKWASEFVYGIEKDYRLAKTAKISCFLNGDGEAKMIRANGLDHFVHSDEYVGALKLSADKLKGFDNPTFDVVLANPPYSVAQYKSTIKHGADSFELWPLVGDKSNDIECLFLERTKHLLRPGGVAGIIFPSSFLNNDGIATAARRLLLKYFEVVAIVHLGSKTFMAASVSTATLFLRRRPDADWQQAQALVNAFLLSGQDTTGLGGVADVFTKYAQEVRGLPLTDYYSATRKADHSVSFVGEYRKQYKGAMVSKKDAKVMTRAEIKAKETQAFLEYVMAQERDRLLDFVLTRHQTTVFVKSPTGNDEQEVFLGYKFSNRRSKEGLSPVDGNVVNGALYSEGVPHDPNKAAGVIHAAFCGVHSVPSALSGTTQLMSLASLVRFDKSDYIADIGGNATQEISPVSTIYPMAFIGDVCEIYKPKSIKYQSKAAKAPGKVKVIESGHIRDGYIECKKMRSADPSIDWKDQYLKNGMILLNAVAMGTAGRAAVFKESGDYVLSNNSFILNASSSIDPDFLVAVLKFYGTNRIAMMAGKSGYFALNSSDVSSIPVPLPTLTQQKKILARLNGDKEMDDIYLSSALGISR